jgi:uncharacterized protein (TIRG00374 family)
MAALKKILFFILRLCVSVALFIFLFKKIDTKVLLSNIQTADKFILTGAFLICLLSLVFAFLRWNMLLATLGITASLKRRIASFAGGNFFNYFLPSTIGGDLIRTFDLALHTKKTREVVATVLLDRLSGYVGLEIVFLAALLLGWKLVPMKIIFLPAILITLLLIALLLLIFNNFFYSRLNWLFSLPLCGKFGEALKSLHEELHIFRKNKTAIIYNVLLSVAIQIISPLSAYVIALSLGLRLSFLYFLIFLPIIAVITLLPISLGGMGFREFLGVYFFATVGVPKDVSLAFSLIGLFMVLTYACLGGLFYVFTLHYRRKQLSTSP